MDLNDYIESNEWDITLNTAVKNFKYYTCCPEPYTDMTFTLKFKRRVAFYTFILILPCSLLSLLTLVIFWVPPESPAKLQLGMNIFLAFFVLLLLLADYTPRAATCIPLIGAYFCFSMIMITMSTVLACTVANMYFRGARINRAPRWLRSCVIHSAAKLLCVHEVIEETRKQPVTPRKTWSTYVTSEISHSDPETLVARTHLLKCQPGYRQYVPDYGALQEITSEVCEPSTSAALPTSPSSSSVSQYDGSSLLDELKSVREMLEDDMAEVDSAELLKKHVREWHMIACVLDKLFFVLYLAVLVLGLGAMMLQSYLL
ncbi:hypothetical protein Btru_072682 [Bulinus truncatus]|nr:hypothetical protein Btru_072682 [Bulinus truncatus]